MRDRIRFNPCAVGQAAWATAHTEDRNGEPAEATAASLSDTRYIGIDVGSETLKAVELVSAGGNLLIGRRAFIEHGQDPVAPLVRLLQNWNWETVRCAAVSGRLCRQVNLPHTPVRQAMASGYRFLCRSELGTIVSLGSHGFSVLELRDGGTELWRENSRCAQGTGNFLRQMVERFSLSIELASELSVDVDDPAELSGRCPVILKTDMAHLANKGEARARILAGLFDAVCQNVLALIRPGITPPDLLLVGGVSRSRRVRRKFAEFCQQNGLSLRPVAEVEAVFLEAVGNAVLASDMNQPLPILSRLISAPPPTTLERLPALPGWLKCVKRMRSFPLQAHNDHSRKLILGFDIGSTGSKLVALEATDSGICWEGYQRTNGDPSGAAQSLLGRFLEKNGLQDEILGLGVTGSGREMVGSLFASCYGRDSVFVLNEIAAHARGALFYDTRVDTIFEIGGQDAKYIRLENGRIVDCAMNEACSAGTGSFIEEQGQRFSGIATVEKLGSEAMSADYGVSLGQHCSVFMAEVIGKAQADGVDRRSIIAGLYDSIIRNYLHRVKGNRSVGKVIFCQGMPFSADALAAAAARRTGSEIIVPPNPGTVGALGIALLAQSELRWAANDPLDPHSFLDARIQQRMTFTCRSTRGCGGLGNKCRIDSIRTCVAEKQQRFVWGGACSLYDKGTWKSKLPDRSPDPFREREDLARELTVPYLKRRGFRTVALTEEFVLRGMTPFYIAYLYEMGFDPLLIGGGDYAALKRGIHDANTSFCAPMQLYHGMAGKMSDEGCDFLFVPMLRGISRNVGEGEAKTCPIVQGSADILKCDLGQGHRARIVSPVIDLGRENLKSDPFLQSCERLARELGIRGGGWHHAYELAAGLQQEFDERCVKIGSRALTFCANRGLAATVVLGRPYTIYNRVLNSNVPSILREQGTVAIPLDCYPVDREVPTFDGMYWGYGQRILRAAHQIRRAPGVYGVYCSNYSCGPDSFNLHFFSHLMEGKPFAVIETDGHSGDAGTKTRVEAFLYCVSEHLKARPGSQPDGESLKLSVPRLGLSDVHREECILIPSLGPGSEIAAAAFRGLGFRAESLPAPDMEAMELGRRHTSGKECAPMWMTLGCLLRRLEQEKESEARFVFMMPGGRGPCRFGVYNLLNQLILHRLGLKDRVRIYSPQDSDYFRGTPPGLPGLMYGGLAAGDLLLAALLDVRPREIAPGTANSLYEHYSNRLLAMIEQEATKRPSLPRVIREVSSGNLFGIQGLLKEAAANFAGAGKELDPPTAAVVGEVYVRLNPFANDFLVEKLEARGIRSRLAPLAEWFEYADYLGHLGYCRPGLSGRFRSAMQRRIIALCSDIVAAGMGGCFHNPLPASLEAAGEFLRKELWGEAVLTLGYAISEYRNHRIDGIVNLGPLECMPTKIAEAQFVHFAEQSKTPVLTLPLDGQSLDPQSLDNFVFELHSRRKCRNSPPHPAG